MFVTINADCMSVNGAAKYVTNLNVYKIILKYQRTINEH